MKLERQAEILKLIHEYEIDTQEELADRLQRAGAIDELGDTGLYVLAPEYYDAAGGVMTC